LEIKELKGFNNEPGVLEYQVKVDFDFKKLIQQMMESGQDLLY
jgi:hypothetical protein